LLAKRVAEEAAMCGEGENGMLSLTSEEVSCIKGALGRYYELIASESTDFFQYEEIALGVLNALMNIFTKHENRGLN